MLKKILCLLLALLLLTGCTPPTPETPVQDPVEESSSEEITLSEDTEDTDTPMDVVLPSAFFTGENMEEFDPEAYAR